MAQANQNLKIEYPAVFQGTQKSSGVNENKIYGARDFIDEVNRRRKAQTWTDAQTLEWCIKALKGAALFWYEHEYLKKIGVKNANTVSKQDLLERFSIFEQTFRLRFDVPVVKKFYAFDTIKAQSSTELPGEYFGRICTTTAEHSKYLTEEAETQHGQLTAEETAEVDAFITKYELGAEARRELADAFKAKKKTGFEAMSDLQHAHITKTFYASGLRDANLRAAAQKALDETPLDDINTMYTAVQRLHARQRPSNKVNAVDPEEQAEGTEAEPTEEVVAVKQKKKNKSKPANKPKNGKTSNPGQQASASSDRKFEKCSFCGMTNHSTMTCYKRIRVLEKAFTDANQGKLPEQAKKVSDVHLNEEGKW